MERRLTVISAADVVGYSKLMGTDEAGTRAQFNKRLEEIIQPAINEHRGRLVKTMGDGFLAVFDGPTRAIKCALAIREELQALGLPMRIGLHSGECELRGADVGGIAVHIAARIVELAAPGDVLVSSTVADLVVGSGLTFEERGEAELKGVPGRWRLFAVASPGSSV